MLDPKSLARLLAIRKHSGMMHGMSPAPMPVAPVGKPMHQEGLANPNPFPVKSPIPFAGSSPAPAPATPIKSVEFHPTGETKGIQFHAPEQPKMPGMPGESKFKKLKI